MVAWDRVRSNKGGRTAGVDGVVPRGAPGAVRARRPVRSAPKGRGPGGSRPSGCAAGGSPRRAARSAVWVSPPWRTGSFRRRRILVPEPIFEADFHPSSHGAGRRAQDAIAEIHKFTSRPADYEWVFEADTRARPTGRTALMGRVRERVGGRAGRGADTGLVGSQRPQRGRRRTGGPRSAAPQGRDLVSALPADYRPIRPGPGAPGANGTHWVRIGERAKHRRRGGAVMKMIRLRQRLRQPRPRVARRRPGAVGAGQPGPVPDGTGPVGGQDETDPHRGGVRYSSGGAPKCRKIDGEPAGRPGPCTHPSKKSPAPIIPAGVRILTRRAAHRTLADLLRRPGPDGSEAGAPIPRHGAYQAHVLLRRQLRLPANTRPAPPSATPA